MSEPAQQPPFISPLATLSRGAVCWLLFYNFLKIATFVVGGGYAIMLAAERIFVERLRWLRPGELMDMLAVIQVVPGLMAGNAAIYVGYRAAGKWGALAAVAGVALPSFTIITLISVGFSSLPMDNSYVQGAFIGVRSALGGLTLAALIRTWEATLRDKFGYALMAIAFAGATFVPINPAWWLFGALAVGLAKAFIATPRNPVEGAAES